jgi:hypothetical protein
VTFTVCPSRTWITGPGAPPAQAQAAYFTPGAICTVMSFSTRFTFTTGPAWRGGSVASYGRRAAASSAAFAGAAPAKLGVAVAAVAPAPVEAMPGMPDETVCVTVFVLPPRVASRISTGIDIPTARPSRSTITRRNAMRSSLALVGSFRAGAVLVIVLPSSRVWSSASRR